MDTFIKHIEKILKTDDRLWSKDEDKKLLKNKLVELVSNDDEKLLGLLLDDSEVKKHFFKKIKDSNIFLKDRFLQFITMNEFLPDSFTAFENEIGLSNDNKLITQKDEISLIFPHKDCILEGGQTKEEAGRDEIFYNTVLAPDEIDRIKEPKVLVNWKKFDKDGKHEVKEISKQDNLIIKGNNLLALYSLLPKYRGEIKLIYIDPPYNTGNDGFKYNDRFNQSTWLTFMKNRLEVAKDLLREDGVIFISLDDTESAYCKILADGIFDKENYLATIAYQRSGSAGLGQGGKFVVNTSESILTYAKNKEKFVAYNLEGGVPLELKHMKRYNGILENEGNKKLVYTFKSKSTGDDVKIYKHSKFIISTISLSNFEKRKEEILTEYLKKFDKIFRLNIPQIENKFQHLLIEKMPDDDLYSVDYLVSRGRNKGKIVTNHYYKKQLLAWLSSSAIMEDNKIIKTNKLTDFWAHGDIPKADIANEGGVTLLRGKKPEQLVKRILDIGSKENDIVLDFFAGAGTTGAVAHKMKRRYVLIEQMDYIHDLPEARLINVINGDQTGISKDVNWKSGGSFVYTELLEWNQKYVDQLEKAKTEKEVFDIYKKIEKEKFYKYKYEPKKFNLKTFKELDLKEQKKALLDILDMNHLFVNRSSMDDTTFKVDEKDKKLTKAFYEEK